MTSRLRPSLAPPLPPPQPLTTRPQARAVACVQRVSDPVNPDYMRALVVLGRPSAPSGLLMSGSPPRRPTCLLRARSIWVGSQGRLPGACL